MSCAPFVSSPPEVVKKMLELAKAGPIDSVCDLGCGDGRILMTAVREFNVRKAFGYEIREDLYRSAVDQISKDNLGARVKLYNDDLFNADLSDATIVTLYLTSSANEKLKPKLVVDARPGTRIVSHDFSFSNWKAEATEKFKDHVIYVYRVPDAFAK